MELRVIFGFIDVALALVSFVFQIAIMATTPTKDQFEVVGTGLWCGLVFLLAGLTALKSSLGSNSQSRASFWENILLTLSGLSVVCGLALMIVSSLSIGERNYYNHICKLPIVKHECISRMTFDGILIGAGLIAIIANVGIFTSTLRQS